MSSGIMALVWRSWSKRRILSRFGVVDGCADNESCGRARSPSAPERTGPAVRAYQNEIMDEKLEASTSETEPVEAGVAPAEPQIAADTAAATGAVRSLDLNELQELSGKKLEALARDLELHLHPARSRHQHILDVVRAALSAGATVTAEGFLDQVSDSFAMLRWPKLNLLPVPEDVCVPRAVTEQYRLRPGQKLAGTMRLPGRREKFLPLNQLTPI